MNDMVVWSVSHSKQEKYIEMDQMGLNAFDRVRHEQFLKSGSK